MPPASPTPAVTLAVTALPTPQGRVQTLAITLTEPQRLIQPQHLAQLTLPPDLDLTRAVVLYGRGPTWLYGYLIHQCDQVPWLGCYDARSQSVVVIHSRHPDQAIGTAIPVTHNRTPCPAILIGGPPNSGKSVLSNALRLSLSANLRDVTLFLHRASWDGEGNWTHETSQPEFSEALVQAHEYRIHENPETVTLIPDFFRYHAAAVKHLRQVVDCLIVDVGGLPQPEKLPLLQQCSHYIVISRLPEAVESWHRFCQPHLTPLAVIHSCLSPRQAIHQTAPWLEMTAGPWHIGTTTAVPPPLLQQVLSQIPIP
jgi:CRISPR-associated protein Csx3